MAKPFLRHNTLKLLVYCNKNFKIKEITDIEIKCFTWIDDNGVETHRLWFS